MINGVPWSQFRRDLFQEIKNDHVSNGAAALAYYLTLSIFPSMIVLLATLPYLPIPNLDQAIMDLLRQSMPEDAASMFTGVVQDVTSQRKGGLLSLGLILTAWAASNGLYAIMQQLNITYGVTETRPFWKARGIAILLMLLFGASLIGAITLIVFGGTLQNWLVSVLGWGEILSFAFSVFRWTVIACSVLLSFSLIDYLGPNTQDSNHRFRLFSLGNLIGCALLAAASLGLKFYVQNFGNYNATYGSIGAVIVLELWLYVMGLIVLVGSEVNALTESYSRPKENTQKAA